MSELDSRSGVLVLLSGGIDSTACVDFYLRQGTEVRALFVDYGQAAGDQEDRACTAIAKHYGIELRKVRCVGLLAKRTGLVQGRNAFLGLVGLMEFGLHQGLVALGLHSGTEYWDCSPGFVHNMQVLFDGYAGGRVQFAAPFLEWTKLEIWRYCEEWHVPIGMTYSCESGQAEPCGRCLSCRDLEALHACS